MSSLTAALHVLIIGGYGEFGGRLAQLLMRDGHTVTVAGRNIDKARQFCSANGGTPLRLDIASDLHMINTLGVDVVVDAAGPYQSYGTDEQRYRVARRALECGAHYLDLSDDGEFSRGITCLDTLAIQHKRFALSGASSTPALSGAVVASLQANLCSIEKIETSILPGCRAPQGHSVMMAILEQVGSPIQFWRNSAWTDHSGWSAPVHKRVGAIHRNANLITAADAVLFPAHFKAKSVLFRAGLAMPIMHKSLQWLGALRAVGLLPNLTKFVLPLRWLADRLTPFGSDYGGMLVEVIGERRQASSADEPIFRNTTTEGVLYEPNNEAEVDEPNGGAGLDQPNDEGGLNDANHNETKLLACSWYLEAQPGQGPFVPTIPTRALLRNAELIPFGARPCISELLLTLFIDAMSDLGIETNSHMQKFNYLFLTVLGDLWQTMPETLRNTHTVIDKKTLNGQAKITRGTSWITQLVAKFFRFPAAADNIPVEVSKTRVGEAEVWVRNFNGQKFKSTLRSVESKPDHGTNKLIQEQFGLLKFLLRLKIDSDGMHYQVNSGACLGIPIPNVLLPISNTREFEKDDTMHFCVELLAPFNLGLIVRYEGWLK